MSPYELLRPASLDEALELIAAPDFAGRPVSGSTAISLMRRAGVLNVDSLVSLEGLRASLNRIQVGDDGQARVDALATLGEMERHAALMRSHPVLAQVFVTLANPRVRNVAMIGGYLSHGDPHMDLPPVLSALDARVTARSVRGSREIPVDQLYQGYYETALAADELVTGLFIPRQPGCAYYKKVTTRARHDWPTLGIAAAFDMTGDRIGRARLFIGAATDRPKRLEQTEALVEGQPWSEALARKAAEAAVAEAPLVADNHGSMEYKQALLRAYLPEVFEQAMKTARPATRQA
ncbi:6-hydroxypseudooxynicotine dehydrogenase complex subunit alpha [Pigmentiphaga humi]|uniref:6-hydroxypseudooxynicotine dehydrogenase complex subunit alpha n=1 Tax=Pigmentiphaga humi TaxID=2478468 RepID=A0A3P4B6Y7_9BURK|nr:FAD binding domain-containing protein [Pigmentiphaga humi]VCU70935.1 6-hydroxypseudooxynicotine dehydrogenase complex subunit alpha [Pigmentiphaga humi]